MWPLRPRAESIAASVELIVLTALLLVLGVAAGKLFVLMNRVGVSAWRSAPVGVLFLGAAILTARRISIRWRGMRQENGNGT